MKTVAIIGAGISGLRAALEFSAHSVFQVTILEKSRSVGGRVATRRFNSDHVNHGTMNFDGRERVLKLDSRALQFQNDLSFPGPSTKLPKLMQERLSGAHFEFNKKVISVDPLGNIETEDGEKTQYDFVILTCPVPQAREILHSQILENVLYSKKILFIGSKDGGPVRIEMTDTFSEEHFDLDENSIREKAHLDVGSLDLKKWRYSKVLRGVKESYFAFSSQTFIAGDAFDPEGEFNIGSAWISGMRTADFIIRGNQ